MSDRSPDVRLPKHTNPPALYDPARHGYSHVSTITATSRVVAVAGQFGVDRHGVVVGADFAAQADCAFANVAVALSSEGLPLASIFSLTVMIVALDDAKLVAFETVVKRRFETGPATVLIPVARLAAPHVEIEIAALAAG